MIGYIIILNEIAGYIVKQMYLSTFLLSLCMCTGSVLNLGQSTLILEHCLIQKKISISGTLANLRKLSYFRNLVSFQDETELRQNIVLSREIAPFQDHCSILRRLSHFRNIVPFQEYFPISGIFSDIRNPVLIQEPCLIFRTLSHFIIMSQF